MRGQCYSYEGMVPVIHPSAYVHPTAVLIGDVRVGPNCYIGPCASLRGDFSSIIVGAGTNIQDSVSVHGTPKFTTVIGEYGHVGHGAVVHGCLLGRNVMVGMGACVYDGSEVGDDAVIAGMAFVTAGTKIPAAVLAGGVPAKVMRELSAEEIARKTRGTEAYQQLAARCLATCHPCEPLAEPEPGREQMDPTELWKHLDLSRARK